MNQFNLYIGADNQTGDRQTETIENSLAVFFEGWTRTDTVGYWQGKLETSTLVTIFTPKDRIYMLSVCRNIAAQLMQDCICLQSLVYEDDQLVHYIDFVPAHQEGQTT